MTHGVSVHRDTQSNAVLENEAPEFVYSMRWRQFPLMDLEAGMSGKTVIKKCVTLEIR